MRCDAMRGESNLSPGQFYGEGEELASKRNGLSQGSTAAALLKLGRVGVATAITTAQHRIPLWPAATQRGERNAHVGSFSIYIHSQPGFVFDTITTRSPFFYGRQLNNSVQVAWGESTMIQAERMLLSAALEDPVNHRFILLSDSCVPLYNFSYVYNYLMSSSRSFVDSFLDKNEARYNPKMSPIIPKEKWRKGSQWIALVRKHVEVVVADDAIFQVFKKYCKKAVGQKEHNCISDEHYMQTLLSMRELGNELEQRTLTYTSWNHSTSEAKKQSWHPMTFEYANASPQHISEIKNINHIYYETERRTEWCQSNATSVPCFLFARKFSLGAAMRLLSEEFGGFFDPRALH